MQKMTAEEIRKQFEFATEFNDLFDAFEEAIKQRVDDLELYKVLFWNKSLSPDEVLLFGEQLVKQFPHLAYNTYMWLGEMSALTLAVDDNFERAMSYYKKASLVHSGAIEPYIKAVACYDPDIKVPPAQALIEFFKSGVDHVVDKHTLYKWLWFLYEQIGNDEMTQYYKRLTEESPEQ